MTLDYLSIVSEEGAKIVAAYDSDPKALVPWSDRWTVGTVARHVAGTHHVVAEIVRGRPDADFGLFGSLQSPEKDAPEFPGWFRAGTASLAEQLSSVAGDDECWSWYPDGRSVSWWARRMAHETLVHRWDVEAAHGRPTPIRPDIAADGIDEYLDVFVAATRGGNGSPTGPTIALECTDQGARWWLDLSEPGGRNVTVDPREASVIVRGSAEHLLLFVWGRVGTSGLTTEGDDMIVSKWQELIPPM